MKFFALFGIFFLSLNYSFGHPIPDLPVYGSFEANGSSSVALSIDTRCFGEDPEGIPFLSLEEFETFTAEHKQSLLGQAGKFVKNSLRVRINQGEWFLPDFSFEFEQMDAEELSEEETLVFIRGFSELPQEPVILNYQIQALEQAQYDLVFTNSINGVPQRRVNVLWPGEESFVLDLSSLVTQTEPSKNEVKETAEPIEIIEQVKQRASFRNGWNQHLLLVSSARICSCPATWARSHPFRPGYFYALSKVSAPDSASLGLYGCPHHHLGPRHPRPGFRTLRLGRTDHLAKHCSHRP
jgi:hypothetical protein